MKTCRPPLAPLRAMPKTQAKILDAAVQLFDRQGINATGVDAVVQAAGVAKMTLYNYYPSKDALIAAALTRQSELQAEWILEIASRDLSGAEFIEALFQDLGAKAARGDYYGCPCVKAASEFPDPRHPLHVVLQAARARTREAVQELLGRAGAANPVAASAELKLLLDGVLVGAHGPEAQVAITSALRFAARQSTWFTAA